MLRRVVRPSRRRASKTNKMKKSQEIPLRRSLRNVERRNVEEGESKIKKPMEQNRQMRRKEEMDESLQAEQDLVMDLVSDRRIKNFRF